MYKKLLWEEKDGIGILKINSPKTLNSLNSELLSELEHWAQSTHFEKLNAVIITGEGKAFVAGADIKEMSELSPSEAKQFGELGVSVFRKLENLKVPVIAAINGYALGGGCELAMACDIRIASEKAKFGQPEVGLGIIPGFSGTQRLSRLIGIARAKELIYTGKVISASKAYEIGLVNYVVDADGLMDEALKLALEISKASKTANKYAKEAINVGIQMDIDSAIAYETSLFAMCFSHEDQEKRMKSFLKKSKK
ncbi:MAG: hypothetical protein CSB16_01675 [Clostridiales bacterium]|nr:MAG: hypothetical protein CSB16_01675 [Clostridiales bacterium]